MLISLPCTSSHASFKKCCRNLVAGLPNKQIAVKQTRSGQNIENFDSAEEKEKFKAAEIEMRRWMILAMIRSDDDVKQIVRDIAREELIIVEAKMMPADKIAGIFKLFNILPNAFKGLKSYMETFWGWRMFASATAVASLNAYTILPITGTWEKMDPKKYTIGTRT